MTQIKIDSNAINNLIKSPKKRKLVYGIYAVLGIVIGSIQVGFDSSGVEAGTWLSVMTSIYIYLSVPFGVLAVVNSPKDSEMVEEVEEWEDNMRQHETNVSDVNELNYSLNKDSENKRKPKH